jgi:hypothetical protein
MTSERRTAWQAASEIAQRVALTRDLVSPILCRDVVQERVVEHDGYAEREVGHDQYQASAR